MVLFTVFILIKLGLPNPSCRHTHSWMQTPSPWMQTPLDSDSLTLMQIPYHLDTENLTLDADPPSHVACDSCCEAKLPADIQTPVKTLPCPKLCLPVVIN